VVWQVVLVVAGLALVVSLAGCGRRVDGLVAGMQGGGRRRTRGLLRVAPTCALGRMLLCSAAGLQVLAEAHFWFSGFLR